MSSTAPLSKYKGTENDFFYCFVLYQITFNYPKIFPFRPATLWEKLGPTESERIFNLGVAVQRAIFTVAKDECLVPKAKNLTLVRQYTAFLCTFFGGPLSNPSCKYNSTISGKQLTTEAEIFSEILQIHWKMGISKDEEYTMSTLFLWAVQSVYFMDENTIVAFGTRLRQLDEYIVKYKNKYGCTGGLISICTLRTFFLSFLYSIYLEVSSSKGVFPGKMERFRSFPLSEGTSGRYNKVDLGRR